MVENFMIMNVLRNLLPKVTYKELNFIIVMLIVVGSVVVMRTIIDSLEGFSRKGLVSKDLAEKL